MTMIRCQVGSHIWMIPPDLVTSEFLSAIEKINAPTTALRVLPVGNAHVVELTTAESEALERVHFHAEVWKL